MPSEWRLLKELGNQCSIGTESCGFSCTGYDGSHRWKVLHDTVKGIECDSCRDHAVKMMSGLHDHVNAGLGEKIYDKDNYAEFAEEVACAYAKCKRDGRC